MTWNRIKALGICFIVVEFIAAIVAATPDKGEEQYSFLTRFAAAHFTFLIVALIVAMLVKAINLWDDE